MNPVQLLRPRRRAGFTLIEVMVVTVIVGILAAIAYPAYGQYVIRANRSAAQSYLMELAQAEQQYLVDARSYASTEAALGMSTPATVAARYSVTITLEAGPPPRFTLTATPVAGTAQAADGALTLDSTGAKTPEAKW